MTARISDYRDGFHREYLNDIPAQTNVLKRIALASLPFLCLHNSFRIPLAIGMGACRIWNVEGNLQKGAALAALVSNIFNFRAGQIFTTVQDIVLEAKALMKCENKEEATKHLIKILNHSVHLALITRGGLELSIMSFAIQALVNLIQSRDEFKNDRWIEGCANLLMAAVRLDQTHSHYEQLKRNREIETAIKQCYVGTLHEKWRFPSDHLPVGIEVNGVRILSWNVLNNAYMEWVTDKDSQGLNGSLISELNQPVGTTGLTQRDILVANMVQDMMSQGQVVALQECSHPFIELLAQRLPSEWEMVKSFNSRKEDQDIILYDSTRLKHSSLSSETTLSAYPSVPNRPLQNAFFINRAGGKDFRIINAHIPGDPTKPGREEFTRYVHKQHKKEIVTVALGDNNFERDEMLDAYRKAGFSKFSLHSPWQTNIDPYTRKSKAIDHFFVVGAKISRDLRPSEIFSNAAFFLRETINLLRGAPAASDL